MGLGTGQEARQEVRVAGAPEREYHALAALGAIRCEPVATPAQQQRWQALLAAEHELGAGPLVGARLGYLVQSEHLGVVGALAFSAAAWQLAGRDRFIGWDAAQRRAHLGLVVCNSRFLIRPHLRVPDLASQVLARCLARLPTDWQARYGRRPVLVETFVDRTRYRGGCYRAGNWRYVGDTRGRGRNDTQHARARTRKAIYVYPLGRRWRQQLGVARPPVLIPVADDWACHEFAQTLVCEQRLHQRVLTVARDFAAQSTASLPQACGSRARTKAAYRLFDHPAVSMATLLASHYQATATRCRQHATVLAVQDTTSLNYPHPATFGLGPIGTCAQRARGLLVHDTLAFTPAGTPLGLLDVQCWARAAQRVSATRARRPLADKESRKWLHSHQVASRLQQQHPGLRVVSVADREGDLYALLHAASQTAQADVLVRARHLRRPERSGARPQPLSERLRTCPVAGERALALPRRGRSPARTARLAIRYTTVTFARSKAKTATVTLYAVQAIELAPPAGTPPLAWTLLTTVPTTSFEEACERLAWYATRWQIEVYHRTLKSGCRIADRQLASTARLENCLAIDLVVAWRVFFLAQQARAQPDQPCGRYFHADQWKALLIRTGAHHDPQPADEPSLRRAVRLVAGLGGFLGRRGDREPGTQTLWRGLERLEECTAMYRILTRPRAPPDG